MLGTIAVVSAAGVAFVTVVGVPVVSPVAAIMARNSPIVMDPVTAEPTVTSEGTAKVNPKEVEAVSTSSRKKAAAALPGNGKKPFTCEVFTANTGYDFINTRYEGFRYKVGYGQHVRYCIDATGAIHVLNADTVPQLVDSSDITLTITDTSETLTPCGDLCLMLTTVVTGVAADDDGREQASAVATVTTTLTGTGASTDNEIVYSTPTGK